MPLNPKQIETENNIISKTIPSSCPIFIFNTDKWTDTNTKSPKSKRLDNNNSKLGLET